MTRVRKPAILILAILSIVPARLHALDGDTTQTVVQDIVITILKSLADRKIDPVRTGESPAWTPEQIGPVSRQMVPDLVAQLKSDDWNIRGRAATALGLIGPDAKDAVTALREQLKHKSGAVRSAAAGAIWSITGESGEMCPILTDLLRGKTKAYHISAAVALGAVGPPARVAVPKLIEALERDEFPSVRATAAASLAKIGVADQAVLGALERAQKDKDPTVREAAGKVLQVLRSGATAQSGEPTVEQCVAALQDQDPQVRAAAAFKLSRFGEAAAKAVPGLIVVLSDKEATVRAEAAWTPARIGPAARAALPTLAKTLRDANLRVRGLSASAIGAQLDASKEYVPALREALAVEQTSAKAGMAAAIWKITGDSSEALPALTGLLSSDDVVKRQNGALGLARVGPPAKEAEPILVKALGDVDPAVRAAASLALAAIGGAKPEVLKAVEKEQIKAAIDLGQRLRSGKTVSREFSTPGTYSAAETQPSVTAPQAGKQDAFSGAVTYEAGETARRYGIKSGSVGDISLTIAPSPGGESQVSGKLSVKLAEKPYYADSEISHAYDCSFSGKGSKSDDGKWHFTATGRYSEKVKGAVNRDAEGSVVVELDLLPDNSVQGVIRGMGAWSPYSFKASAK